jgi:hypothetical protein
MNWRRSGFFFAIGSVLAGQAPTDPTFRATAKMVQVSIVAHDSKGAPVADLRREEFQILDNRAPQEIRVFVALERIDSDTALDHFPLSLENHTRRAGTSGDGRRGDAEGGSGYGVVGRGLPRAQLPLQRFAIRREFADYLKLPAQRINRDPFAFRNFSQRFEDFLYSEGRAVESFGIAEPGPRRSTRS